MSICEQIRADIRRRRRPPTLAEIAKATGLSYRQVYGNAFMMVRAGFLVAAEEPHGRVYRLGREPRPQVPPKMPPAVAPKPLPITAAPAALTAQDEAETVEAFVARGGKIQQLPGCVYIPPPRRPVRCA